MIARVIFNPLGISPRILGETWIADNFFEKQNLGESLNG